jgi:serine/threonine-protein kinase
MAASRDLAGDGDCFESEGLPRRFGRYLLLRVMARGGMGQVFLGSTTGVEGAERPVVIKVIRREHAKDSNFLARFLDEARVQSQLHNSGVAQVLEAASHESSGDPYVVMEHVEGRSLGQVRRRLADVGLRLRWEDAVAIGVLVVEPLSYIHERSDASGKPLDIVHRDLSPHNVMVGYGGEVKVIDFGTARGQNRRCHTVAGVVFAKPGYVAPEVANGDSGDFRVDLYAAGVMLWELCAGRRFLQGDPKDHTAAVAAGERELPPIAARVGAPAGLDQVLRRLTAFAREERFESARSACAQLAALLQTAAPLPNGERGTRARVAQLMYNLYPAQPGRSRREFARLVAAARSARDLASWAPPEPAPAPAPTPAEAGPLDELLAGTRYRIRREIGRGASSVVYEAVHVELGRRVAIKVLDADHTCSRDFSLRFRREARALSRLHHPGLVRVFDFGQAADGRLFCVMELLDGRTLRQELEESQAVPWERALRIARKVCLALAAAHARQVIHRDIKPENVFVADGDQVKLIDFGLARTSEDPEARGDDAPEGDMGAMTLFGTPEYMAPEQVAGGQVDHRADVYALGCVLYEMLTGRLPFRDGSAVKQLDAKLRGNPEPAHLCAPQRGIPRAVSRLTARALARHPSRRFASAAEMADAISDALDEPTRRRTRRRALGASVVAATMGFAVVLLVQVARPWLEELPARLPWLRTPTEQPRERAPEKDHRAEPDDDPGSGKSARRP